MTVRPPHLLFQSRFHRRRQPRSRLRFTAVVSDIRRVPITLGDHQPTGIEMDLPAHEALGTG